MGWNGTHIYRHWNKASIATFSSPTEALVIYTFRSVASLTRDYQDYLAHHPAFQATADSRAHTTPDPTFYKYSTYVNAVNQMANQLGAQQITPKQALSQLQQKVTTIQTQR